MSQITDPKISQLLSRLHQEASSQKLVVMKGAAKAMLRGMKLKPEDMQDAYLAISASQGNSIYERLIQCKARNIVEFGTSFGISTIYLAAAAKENDGKVITSELLPEKCKVARENFTAAGLSEWIELLEGDALETLKDVPDGIDFLLLDGWNDLYLPLIKMLEPKLKNGAWIYTDNVSFPNTKPFLQYLSEHPEKYQSERIEEDKGAVLLTQYLVPSPDVE